METEYLKLINANVCAAMTNQQRLGDKLICAAMTNQQRLGDKLMRIHLTLIIVGLIGIANILVSVFV